MKDKDRQKQPGFWPLPAATACIVLVESMLLLALTALPGLSFWPEVIVVCAVNVFCVMPVLYWILSRQSAKPGETIEAFGRKDKREEAVELTQAVIDSLPNSLIIINRDHTVALANKAALEKTGNEISSVECLKCHQILRGSEFPCGLNENQCPLELVIKSGKPVTVEQTRIDETGRSISAEICAVPVFDERGEIAQIIESSRDLTERWRAERNLRVLLDNLPCIAMVLRKGSREIVASNKMAREAGAVPGKTCYVTCAKYHQSCSFCLAPKVWETGESQSLEVEMNGRHYQGTWVPLTDDLYVHYIFDITDRKLAEIALKESKDKLQEALKIARLGHYVFDITTGFWKSSAELDSIFGIDRNFKRDVDGWLKIVHPEYREIMFNYLAEDILTQHGKFDREYKIVNAASGQEKWVHGLGDLKFDQYGSPIEMFGTIQDVTDRRQAEEQLRESEEKSRTLVESINVVPWRFDLKKSKFTFIGKQVERILGFPAESWTDINSWSDRIHHDDRNAALEMFRASIRRGRDFEHEYRYLTDAGDTVWMRDIVTVRTDNKGIPFELVGYMVDITPRKKVETELLKFKLAFERSGEAIFLTDIDGNIIYVNSAFEKLYGHRREEALGKTPRILKSGLLSRKVYEEFWQTLLDKRMVSGEMANKTRDGRIVDIDSSVNPVLDASGNIIAFLAIQRDITDRKQAEEALIESENRFQELFNSVLEGIGFVDQNEIIKFVNPAFVRIFGEPSAESMLGRNLLDYFSKDQRELVLAETGRRRRGISSQYEIELLTRSSGKKHLYVSVTPKLNRNGEYEGAFGTVLDITETKRLRELESRAERLEMAGTIAGQVAHDFNNLLAPLMAYPEFIREELPEDSNARTFLDDIENVARKIADINQDLLTMGRRGHITQEILDLNRIVLLAVKEIEAEAPAIVFEIDLGPDLMSIKGGSAQIHRLLINLLVNARDAMKDSGRIAIKTENYYANDTSVVFGRIPIGEYVKLTVSDNGCGIPDNILQQIFDPFYTTKTADRKRGSGLGLSVVDAVMKDHNGFIDVASRVGRGTSFYLYFPVTREETGEIESGGPAGGTETILIVDDDKIQRDVASRLLRKLGYNVNAVESGEKAVEFLRQNPQDLVILDMVMPGGMDGTDTYRKILEINSAQKAIILSGFSESDRVLEAHRLGAGTFVRKPVTKNIIAAAVRSELDRKSPDLIPRTQ